MDMGRCLGLGDAKYPSDPRLSQPICITSDDNSEPDCEAGQFGTPPKARFVSYTFEMRTNRARTYEESVRDFLIGQTLRDQCQYLALSI